MKTILILRDRPSSPMFYFIDHFISRWEDAGYRVINHIGSENVPEADILILHINLTIIPQEYVDIISKFPLVINGKILDISRRRFSQLLVSMNDDYTGQVIVKTNNNFGGKPENDKLKQKHLLNTRIKNILNLPILNTIIKQPALQLKKKLGKRKLLRKWEKIATMNPLSYPIFKDIKSVPSGVWKNDNLVVERFINDSDDGLFYAYYCVFLGDKEISGRLGSKNPIVKFSNKVLEERFPTPVEVKIWRKELEIDFGRLDYLKFKGQYFLIDVNKTEGGGVDICYDYQEELDFLASGLEYFQK